MPVTHIEPQTRGFRELSWRELWAYRELLYFLTWRDIKVRYKQTALGAAWAILQPLLLMIVFAVFLGRLARVPSEGFPYPVFAYSALVPWTLFASSMTAASESLVGSQNLITKVYFPRILVPVSAAGSFFLDFLLAFGVLIGMMAYYGIAPTGAVVWLPLFTLLAVLTSMAAGIFLSALNVRYRDVRYAVPFLVQLWLFLSPVAYAASLVPDRFQTLYGLNPMAGVVEGFRWALLGQTRPDMGLLLVSGTVVVLWLVLSVVYFQRTEQTFADVV